MTFQKDLSVPGKHPSEPITMDMREPLPLGCLCTWSYHPNNKTKDLKYINMACPLHFQLVPHSEVRHLYIQDWQGLYEKNNGHKKGKRGRPRKSETKGAGVTDFTIEL